MPRLCSCVTELTDAGAEACETAVVSPREPLSESARRAVALALLEAAVGALQDRLRAALTPSTD